MGDVIVGKPFCKEVDIYAKIFDRILTFLYGNKKITYVMPRAHPHFKHVATKVSYRFPPFLFIEEEDL